MSVLEPRGWMGRGLAWLREAPLPEPPWRRDFVELGVAGGGRFQGQASPAEPADPAGAVAATATATGMSWRSLEGRSSTGGGLPQDVFTLGVRLDAFPPALRAQTLIGNLYASIPKRVVTAGRFPEDAEADGGHVLLNHLLENPHPLIPGATFWQWLGERCFAEGNAVAWIERTQAGRPLRLHPAACSGIDARVDLGYSPSAVEALYYLTILQAGYGGLGGMGGLRGLGGGGFGMPSGLSGASGGAGSGGAGFLPAGGLGGRAGPAGPANPGSPGAPGIGLGGIGALPVPARDVLHFRGAGFMPWSQESRNPLRDTGLRRTFLQWQAVNIYVERVLRCGVIAPFVIQVGDQATAEEVERIGNRLRSLHSGVAATGNALILYPEEKVVALNVQAIEAELVRLKEQLTVEIAQFTGVPPFLMYAYANNAQAWQRPQLASQWSQYLRSNLTGQFLADGQECSKKLLSYDAYARQRVRFDARALELGSFEETLRALGQATQKDSLLKPNEAREIARYGPIPGGDRLRSPTGAPAQAAQAAQAGQAGQAGQLGAGSPPLPPGPPAPPPASDSGGGGDGDSDSGAAGTEAEAERRSQRERRNDYIIGPEPPGRQPLRPPLMPPDLRKAIEPPMRPPGRPRYAGDARPGGSARRYWDADARPCLLVFCDLDGTLCNPIDAEPIGPGIELLQNQASANPDAEIVFLTGRAEDRRAETETWLRQHVEALAIDALILMRAADDDRPNAEYKVGALEAEAARRAIEVERCILIDDNPAAIELASEAGAQVRLFDG